MDESHTVISDEKDDGKIVLLLVDQIVLSDGAEVGSVIQKLRDHCDGNAPSFILRNVVFRDPELAERVKLLQIRNEELEAKVGINIVVSQTDDKGNKFYNWNEFLRSLQAKMGRSYGWKIDCVNASTNTLNVREIKSEELQRWQNSGKVPEWAYEQIDRLNFPTRRKGNNSSPPWSNSDYDFLANLYLSNPSQKNDALADACSKHFQRPIGENAIKGALNRLREKGILPKYRKDSIEEFKKSKLQQN